MTELTFKDRVLGGLWGAVVGGQGKSELAMASFRWHP